jgi:hypothetical protein
MKDYFGEEIKVGDVCMVVDNISSESTLPHKFEIFDIVEAETSGFYYSLVNRKRGRHFKQNLMQSKELVRIGEV